MPTLFSHIFSYELLNPIRAREVNGPPNGFLLISRDCTDQRTSLLVTFPQTLWGTLLHVVLDHNYKAVAVVTSSLRVTFRNLIAAIFRNTCSNAILLLKENISS